jgi:GNAT superfamily N-acetyltransferase
MRNPVDLGTAPNAPQPRASAIRCEVVEGTAPALIAELCKLIRSSWDYDYPAQAINEFDEQTIHTLLERVGSFGITARDLTGRLVGCELAFPRTLRKGARTFKAYYVTLLTVDPTKRRTGIARRILEALTHEALNERGALLLCSVFDEGHAGLPTVQASTALVLLTSPTFRFWGRTSDLRLADQYERLQGLTRLALLPGVRQLVQGRRSGPIRALLNEPATLAGCDFPLAFEVDTDLLATYTSSERAGALRISCGTGASCSVAYQLGRLRKPGLPTQRIGQIQYLVPHSASPGQIAQALRVTHQALINQGCLFTVIAETGALAATSLLLAGFVPLERRMRFALRAREAVIRELGSIPKRALFDVH